MNLFQITPESAKYPSEAANLDVVLTRLPILDVDENIQAYELIFHPKTDVELNVTAKVIVQTLDIYGVEESLGVYDGFINVSESMLFDSVLEQLPSQQVVLIISIGMMSAELIERCQFLHRIGFRFALNGFNDYSELKSILDLIYCIKLDLSVTPFARIPTLLRQIKEHSAAIPFVTKVETERLFLGCKALGLILFQGGYFSQTDAKKILRHQRRQQTITKIVSLIELDADFGKIEPLFRLHPDLYIGLLQLVRLVTSGGGMPRIGSLAQVNLLVGQDKLLDWLRHELQSSEESGFGSELLELAIMRARMMELLANQVEALHPSVGDQAFLVGILSLADSFLKQPLEQVIKQLGVNDNLANAVLHYQGSLGQFLKLVKLVEIGDFEHANPLIHGLYLSDKDFSEIQGKASKWAHDL